MLALYWKTISLSMSSDLQQDRDTSHWIESQKSCIKQRNRLFRYCDKSHELLDQLR